MTDSEFRREAHRMLRLLESKGHDFCGEACPKCGIVDSEPCCPTCLAHNGGKLGGVRRHEPGCELKALIDEAEQRTADDALAVGIFRARSGK